MDLGHHAIRRHKERRRRISVCCVPWDNYRQGENAKSSSVMQLLCETAQHRAKFRQRKCRRRKVSKGLSSAFNSNLQHELDFARLRIRNRSASRPRPPLSGQELVHKPTPSEEVPIRIGDGWILSQPSISSRFIPLCMVIFNVGLLRNRLHSSAFVTSREKVNRLLYYEG